MTGYCFGVGRTVWYLQLPVEKLTVYGPLTQANRHWTPFKTQQKRGKNTHDQSCLIQRGVTVGIPRAYGNAMPITGNSRFLD